MSASIGALYEPLQEACRDLIQVASDYRLNPQITSTLRTYADQSRLYRRYQAGLQPYYVAPPGTSPHEWGYAFDMVVAPMEALNDLGQLWEQWGGYWGGHQSDPVHFQYPGFAAYKKTHPLQSTSGVVEKTVDIASAFAPGVGEIQALFDIARYAFPGLPRTYYEDMIQHPYRHRNEWLAVSWFPPVLPFLAFFN